MQKNKLIIPSYRSPILPLQVTFLILMPIIGFMTWKIIGPAGEAVLLFFWLIFFISFIRLLLANGERAELSDSGIILKQGKTEVFLGWDDIEQIGFQALVAKRMGIPEAIAYLAIKVREASQSKLSPIKSSNEFGFVQKLGDLNNYMGEIKSDLYVNMAYAKESDEEMMLQLLPSKSRFNKAFSPLVKTSNQAEYENLIKNFQQ